MGVVTPVGMPSPATGPSPLRQSADLVERLSGPSQGSSSPPVVRMPRRMATQRSTGFRGRGRECAVLDRLLDDVRGGQSAVVVIRGEAGVGKTDLLRYAAGQASGCRIAKITGVEAEMELPFAGLHQLFV